jgi:3-oxoadipate enol-lactonase
MPTLDFPWGRMAYTNSGQGAGRTVVFLHGSGCDSADWAGVLACLPPATRRLCLDFRGHGASDAPAVPFSLGDLAGDVLALVERLGLEAPLLVGHSLGGMVALEAARWKAASGATARLAGLVLLEGWTSLSAATSAFVGQRFYGRLAPSSVLSIRAKWEATLGRTSPENWQAFWRTVEAFDGWGFLQQARLPIWEVYGGLGRNEPAQALLRVPANACIRWRWIEGVGHYLTHEAPAEVAEVVSQALEQLAVLEG